MAKPRVRCSGGSMSATKARNGSMLMLMEASRIQSSPAAIHSDRTPGHEDESDGAEDRADQEVRAPAAERAPRPVAHVPDDRLDDQAGQRRCQPEDRNLVRLRAKVLVDGAHVGHLQRPAELNSEKSETHVPDLPERQARFNHGRVVVIIRQPDPF